MAKVYALSVKQPWATLLVHGLKTVEVRRWPTARRGRVLIHAARVPDERPEGWARVPPEMEPLARQLGGIVGSAELADCVPYRSVDAFLRERDKHLNEADWYSPPVLYGFHFRSPELIPFTAYSGWMRFFPVDWTEPAKLEPPAAS
jgi:hypothetical protein